MDKKRNFIIEKAKILFFKVGIYYVSMNDLAQACGVSKKTIYCHFESKNEIISDIIPREIEDFNLMIQNLIASDSEKITKSSLTLLSFFKILDMKFSKYDIVLLYDLKKYYNQIYLSFVKYNREIIGGFLVSNIRHGIVKGWYRKILDVERLVHMYIKFIEFFYMEKKRKQ